MIDMIVKTFRGIITVLIVIQLLAVLIFGIISIIASPLYGSIILVGGSLLVIIVNGLLCTFLKIEEHLYFLRNGSGKSYVPEKIDITLMNKTETLRNGSGKSYVPEKIDMTLMNKTETTIASVYTRDKGDTEWDKRIVSIEGLNIRLQIDPSIETYDFKLGDSKGNVYTKYNVNIEQGMTLTFTSADKEQTTIIQ